MCGAVQPPDPGPGSVRPPGRCRSLHGDDSSAVRDGRRDASACPERRGGARRWRATARWPGPRGGTSDAAAGRAMARASGPPGAPGLGTNRAPAQPPWAGEFTVARTCVLIKMASHVRRTCVLITCMSQASYGPWPRSDVIPWCCQNGRIGPSGTAGRRVTWHDRGGGSASSRRAIGRAPAPGAGRSWWPAAGGMRRPATGPARAAAPRLSRSLLVPRGGQRGPAAGSARPRPANPRAPCGARAI
jgi:hypothetical protein